MTPRVVELIERKRDGGRLTSDEIDALVQGYTTGDVPDYQMSAFCMAVVWRGMDAKETAALTAAMVRSGERLDLSRFGRVVDKHSTGGVGDKTTIVVAPLVAACGVPVAKMSGRGLGFSGGTLDKLESIEGYRVDLTTAEFVAQLERIGIVVTGQTADLAPADGKIYALRDTTGTVPAIPLIASSVMSKKIAAGARAVVLDVKVGRGAVMKDLTSARALAKTMVAIGVAHGRAVTCELTDMEQPLGRAVGNSLQIGVVAIGIASVRLGAGREKKGDPIDHRTGIVLRAKVGDQVERGEPYVDIHVAGRPEDADAIAMVHRAFGWSPRRVPRRRLVLGRIASRPAA